MTHEQLAELDSTERAAALDSLEAEVMRGGQPRSQRSIAARLRAYEEKFGISTAEMLRKFASGGVREDEEISAWLFWAHAEERQRAGR